VLTAHQKAFGESIEALGGVYLVARSLDDVVACGEV